MNSEIEARLNLAKNLSLKAGEILISNFGKNFSFEKKQDGSLVSEIDIEIEKWAIPEIRRNFPEDVILSEESQKNGGNGGFLWVIDPLDGTHNYIKGMNLFGSSFAICRHGYVQAGVINLPFRNEVFWAAKGEGAYCNDREISVSKRGLENSTMIFDSSIGKNPEKLLKVLDVLSRKVFNIRMFGSSVWGLCEIANGGAEFEIEFFDRSWDFAAGLLIIEEAGGRATTLFGERWSLEMQGYVVSNGIFHDEILAILKKVLTEESSL